MKSLKKFKQKASLTKIKKASKKIQQKTSKKIKQQTSKLKDLDAAQKQKLKRWAVTGFVFFVVIVALVFLVVFAKYATLEQEIQQYVSVYGFIAIFVIAFVVDILMQPIGPEIPLIAGIVSGLNVFGVVLFTALGSALASLVGYWLGQKYGHKGFMKIYPEKVYKKWKRRYLRNGNLVLAIAALSPVPYVPVCWLSGMFEMKKMHFVFFGIVTRIARIVGVAYLTFVFSM